MNFNKIFSALYIKFFKLFPLALNRMLAKFFKKLHDLNLISSYGSDFLAEMNIENTNFKLWLMKDDVQAQSVYLPLHKKKITYETIMIKTLLSTTRKLDFKNFLDLGSFMGYYACFVSKYFEERLEVFAIESNPYYSQYIKKSIAENNLKNIHVINEILSDKEENLFVYKEGTYKSKQIYKKSTNSKSKTLDQICFDRKIYPELIKIDVHGAEGKVLLGSKKVLKDFTKIILLELHSNNYIKKFSDGLNREKILELLISLDFKCYLISSFRDFEKSEDLQNQYYSNKKFQYIEVNLKNFNEVFFDRYQTDQFIFACKKEIDIKGFDCF